MSNPSNDNLLDRLLAKLAASRFLTISVLLHIMLVVASGSFVLYKAVEEQQAMGVPGDTEFLTEGANQVEAPPVEDSAPAPQLEQVADTMPTISEVSAPTVTTTTNVSSALDSVLTTTATTAAYSMTSNPAATTASSISQNLASNASSVSNAIKRAGKVAPLAGAVSSVEILWY